MKKFRNQVTPTVAMIILNDFFKCLTDVFLLNFSFSSLHLINAFLLNDNFFFVLIYTSYERVSRYRNLMAKMKSHNCSVFLNVYVALIYVAMWRNEEWSHFSFLLLSLFDEHSYYFLYLRHMDVCLSMAAFLLNICCEILKYLQVHEPYWSTLFDKNKVKPTGTCMNVGKVIKS